MPIPARRVVCDFQPRLDDAGIEFTETEFDLPVNPKAFDLRTRREKSLCHPITWCLVTVDANSISCLFIEPQVTRSPALLMVEIAVALN